MIASDLSHEVEHELQRRYRILGTLRDSMRPNLELAQSLVTGELLLLSRPTNEDPGAAQAIRHEGRVFGEVINPYVHTVVDWGSEDPYIAWEYLAAWPLSTVLRDEGRPDVASVLQTVQSIARGLAAVHARGAVYRGLHPGRVLVLRDGSARLATSPEAVLTTRGRHVETGPPADTSVHYLAPEQIEGVIDVRSDLYSLAAIGYELLTGTKLYSNLDPVTMAVQILKTTPPPPSSHRPEVPEEVDALFLSCLARDPDERPESVTALVGQLDQLLEGVAAPDTEPVAGALSAMPVIFPLLAEDADEAQIYKLLADQPWAPVTEEEQELPRRYKRPKRTAFAEETDLIAGTREARLVTTDGTEFRLEGKRMVVGRSDHSGHAPDVDLAEIDTDQVVSRDHAVLDFSEGGWYVSDLKGTNGTWLNGARVRKGAFLRLRPGDTLRVANIMLYYKIEITDGSADGHA